MIVFLPYVEPFELEHLDEALDGNPKLVQILGICSLHLQFRVSAMICEDAEECPRAIYAKTDCSDVKSAIVEFNRVMEEELKIRHGFHKDDKGIVKINTHNGHTGTVLSADWASNESYSYMISCRRNGAYKSKYWRALFELIAKIDPQNVSAHPPARTLAHMCPHTQSAARLHTCARTHSQQHHHPLVQRHLLTIFPRAGHAQ